MAMKAILRYNTINVYTIYILYLEHDDYCFKIYNTYMV